MYSVTDQQKTNEFDSQMKKIKSKTLRQRSLDKWSNIMYIMYSVTDLSPLSKMKKSRLKERQFQLTNFTQR